jgi:hypothetical protein
MTLKILLLILLLLLTTYIINIIKERNENEYSRTKREQKR